MHIIDCQKEKFKLQGGCRKRYHMILNDHTKSHHQILLETRYKHCDQLSEAMILYDGMPY